MGSELEQKGAKETKGRGGTGGREWMVYFGGVCALCRIEDEYE